MKFDEFKSLVESWQKNELEVLDRKAHDYATGKDSLSNFKDTALMADIPVEKVFMTILGIKMCRLRELTGGKQAKNESVSDTLMDMKNYLSLFQAYLYEKNSIGGTTPNG